jgi:hypothetical protein
VDFIAQDLARSLAPRQYGSDPESCRHRASISESNLPALLVFNHYTPHGL